MSNEKLFIHLTPKIAKQLEMAAEKDEWDYYEILNLSHNSKSEDISRSLNRALDLLSRLKYNPQFKDDAASVSQKLEAIAQILSDPSSCADYDARLNEHKARLLKSKIDSFRQLAEATAQYLSIGESEKILLQQFATHRGVPGNEAQSVVDSISISAPIKAMIAPPPTFTASLPRHLETESFQLLLKKSLPVFESINTFRCGNCGLKTPVTLIACECGSLLRGKVFCAQCNALYSQVKDKCPFCGNESNIMIALSEADILIVRKWVQGLMNQGKYAAASMSCKDMLLVKPGDESVQKYFHEIEKQTDNTRIETDASVKCPKSIHTFFYIIGAVLSVLTFAWLIYGLIMGAQAFMIFGYICLALAIVSGIIGWMLHALAGRSQSRKDCSQPQKSKIKDKQGK